MTGVNVPINLFWRDAIFRLGLFKTHNRADAEDVVQTVFMKLLQRQASFDSDEHLKAWLLRVTATCSIDVLRDPWGKNHAALKDADEVISRTSSSRDEEAFCDSPAALRESRIADAAVSLSEKLIYESYTAKSATACNAAV